jgi:hypothetical protein
VQTAEDCSGSVLRGVIMRTAPKAKNRKITPKEEFTGDKEKTETTRITETYATDPVKIKSNPVAASSALKGVSNQEKRQLIAEAAYFRAQRRNFIPGYELEDWFSAEAEIELRLKKSGMDRKSKNA